MSELCQSCYFTGRLCKAHGYLYDEKRAVSMVSDMVNNKKPKSKIPPFTNLYIGAPTKGKRLVQFWVSEEDAKFWKELEK